MDVTVESIVSVLVLLTLLFLLYVIGSNCISVIRNGLYVPVNCWFCNQNSKVLFANRNSFVCEFCQQYNGFNKNGDYNKIISAQYDFAEKSTKYAEYQSVQPNSNGLCNYCNNNQQLKVFQLANFVPLNENNYDVEIEHFEQQLENSYKLCDSCSKVVKAKIHRQNAWLFGNRIKNLKVLRKNFSYLADSNTAFVFRKVIQYSLLICSVLCVALLVEKNICTKQRLQNILSNKLKPYLVFFLHSFNDVLKEYSLDYNVKFLKQNLPQNLDFHFNELFSVSLFGFFLQIISITFSKNIPNLSQINETMSWVMLLLTSGMVFPKKFVVFLDTVQIFCGLWLVYSFEPSAKKGASKKLSIKKRPGINEDKYHLDNDLNETKSVKDHNPIIESKTAITNRLNRSFSSKSISKTDILHNSIKEDCKEFNNCQPPTKNELNSQFNLLNIGNNSSSMSSLSSSAIAEENNIYSVNPFLAPNMISQDYYRVPPSYAFCRSPTKVFYQQGTLNMFSDRPQLFSPALSVSNQSQFVPANHSFSVPKNTFLGISQQLDNNCWSSANLNRSNFSSGPIHCNTETGKNVRKQFLYPTAFGNNSESSLNNIYRSSESLHLGNNSISSTLRPTAPCKTLYNSVSTQENLNSSIFGSSESVKSSGYSFRPLSPQGSVKSTRSVILSPSKFNSQLSENTSNYFVRPSTQHLQSPGIFKLSDMPNNKVISSVNSLNNRELLLGDRHAVFSCNVSVNGHSNINPFVECSLPSVSRSNSGSSRSSSRSSGFISSNELPNIQSFSLPGSRSHSPERNSVLSEPPYHLKLD